MARVWVCKIGTLLCYSKELVVCGIEVILVKAHKKNLVPRKVRQITQRVSLIIIKPDAKYKNIEKRTPTIGSVSIGNEEKL